MRVRRKWNKQDLGRSGDFGIDPGTIIVWWCNDSASSEFYKYYEVFLPKLSRWKDFRQALQDGDIETDKPKKVFWERL